MADSFKLTKKEYKKLICTYGKLTLLCQGQGPYTLVRQDAEREMAGIRESVLRHHGRYDDTGNVSKLMPPAAANLARFHSYYRAWKNEQLVKLGLATERVAA